MIVVFFLLTRQVKKYSSVPYPAKDIIITALVSKYFVHTRLFFQMWVVKKLE